MTKKHYEAIAAAIESQSRVRIANNPEAQSARLQALCDVAEQFAIIARRDNPRFNRERFMSACGFKVS